MAETLVLQDWTTIALPGDLSIRHSLAQPCSGWLDISRYDDFVVTLECKSDATGKMSIQFQCSPSADEGSFVSVLWLSCTIGVQTASVLRTASFCGARFVRWFLANGTPFGVDSVTFRAFVSGYRYGARSS